MNKDTLTRKVVEKLAKAAIALMPKSYFTVPQKADKYMLSGDDFFQNKTGECFTCGFAKEVLTPEDASDNKYFIAGYDSNNKAQGVLDDIFARAIYIDDNTGRGAVIICALDAVGISRRDINDIRKIVIESGKIPHLKSISICSTHSHSSIDTQGLWGEKFYKSGRNEDFMQNLKEKTANVIIKSYENRKNGNLFYSVLKTEDLQCDYREPHVYDSNLTKIRFEAENGENIVLVNFACHAELLGSKTTQVSADFPAYMIKEIEQANKSTEVVYINGAIGGMITAKEIKKIYRHEIDCEKYTRDYGKLLGELVTGMTQEEKIEPVINVKSIPVKVEASNFVLILARLLKVLNNDIYRGKKRSQAFVATETGYMELGKRQVGLFLIPGELFPELWNGQFMSAEESATGNQADYKVITSMNRCEHHFVVGLCNDEIGYIIPDNDFVLNEKMPYINPVTDRHGRRHYEETNSTGPFTARTILNATEEIMNSLN